MAVETNISWTNTTWSDGTTTPGSSWNPWIGCHRVSEGCKLCYADRDMARYGRNFNEVKMAAGSTFLNPEKWARNGTLKPGSKIFTCSWSDFFIEEADGWRKDAWKVIKSTPYTYLILTKRVGNILDRLPSDWGQGYKNVWLGITAENQKRFDERLPKFKDVPAVVKFISAEPLLSGIDMSYALYKCSKCGARVDYKDRNWQLSDGEKFGLLHYHDDVPYPFEVDPLIQWVITGGESDQSRARPMDIDWVKHIHNQAFGSGIAFFHKQHGTWLAKHEGFRSWKGDDPSEWEPELRVQQFPNRS